MNKEINVAFLDKKLETDIKIPLVRGDKNAYKLIMDLGKYPDCKYVFIYAERADGETVYDSFEASGKREEYILKQSIYSVLGDVSVRVVLKDNADSVLTASILRFNVIDGAYSENMAEDMESLENVLLVAEKKADKAETLSGYGIKDAYTKTEVDNKFGGVYRYCGSASVYEHGITVQATDIGDVYNIAEGGSYSTGANVSIPINHIEGNTMYLATTVDNTVLAIAINNPDCMIGIGKKGSIYPNLEVFITNAKMNYITGHSGAEMTFEIAPDSPNTEIDIENWEICYLEWKMDINDGDNVVWTGKTWDKLSASVDTSKFATKDELPEPFELIDSDTLTQDVVTIVPSVNGRYKELYVVLSMPTTNEDNLNSEKCRINLMEKNNKALLRFPEAFIPNYTLDWVTGIQMRMLENQFKSDIWHMEKRFYDSAYCVPTQVGSYNGATSLGKLDKNYVDYVEIQMFSPNNGRVFPAGTTYELWGVKV